MTALNSAVPQSQARKPTGKVLFGGSALPGWESISVDLNAHYSASSWEVTYPLYALPASNGIEWWSSQTDVDVEIQIANDASASPVSMLSGMLDDITLDFDRGLLELRGRDYSGAFIDSIVTQNYLQQTSSEIAAAICANHPQLTPQITSTSTPVGRYYNEVGSRLSRNESEWDFLTALAQEEGFVVLIRGKTFYFGPPPTPDASSPFLLNFVPPVGGQLAQGNVKALSCKHSLTIARDIKVVVQSWHRQRGNSAIKATYTVSNNKRGRQTGAKVSAQIYTYNVPNLTQQQAQQMAEAKAVEISRHERIIDATTFGDTAVNQDTVIQLQGTGSDFDQTYYPDTLKHEVNVSSGYEMTVSAKNHSTYSTVPL